MDCKKLGMIAIGLLWCSIAYSFYQLTPIDEAGNFLVDESVRHFYLYAPKQDQNKSIILIDPEQNQYNQKARHLGFQWLKNNHLEWATVRAPLRGKWQLKNYAPDTYIILHTNLGIKSNQMPLTAFLYQLLSLEISMVENGKIITRNQFIDPLIIKLKEQSQEGKIRIQSLKDTFEILPPEQLSQGILRKNISIQHYSDQYQLDVTVQGKTFQRLLQQKILIKPIPFDVLFSKRNQDETDQNNHLTLKMKEPFPLSHLNISAEVIDPLGIHKMHSLKLDEKTNQFNLTLPRIFNDQFYQVQLYIQGELEKKSIKIMPPIYQLKGWASLQEIQQKLKQFSPQIPFRLKEPQPRMAQPKPKVKIIPKKTPWYQKKWVKISLYIYLAFLIIAIISGSAFFYWKKKKSLAKLAETENNDETKPVEKKEEVPTEPEIKKQTTLQGTGIKSSGTTHMANSYDNDE